MSSIPRVILVLPLLLLLVASATSTTSSASGYWEPYASNVVDRGDALHVIVANRGMSLAALTATIYNPGGVEIRTELVPLQDVITGSTAPSNWTTVSFDLATSEDWEIGPYRLELHTCNECVGRQNANWTYLSTSLVFDVRENPVDIYDRLLKQTEAAERGEESWPAYIIALSFALYVLSLYVSVRALKAYYRRPPTATAKSSVVNVARGLLRFNLPHDPRTYWNNKILAKAVERRRQLREELAATERTIASRQKAENVELVRDILKKPATTSRPPGGNT